MRAPTSAPASGAGALAMCVSIRSFVSARVGDPRRTLPHLRRSHELQRGIWRHR
jgi:hypothetical protein